MAIDREEMIDHSDTTAILERFLAPAEESGTPVEVAVLVGRAGKLEADPGVVAQLAERVLARTRASAGEMELAFHVLPGISAFGLRAHAEFVRTAARDPFVISVMPSRDVP